MPTKAALDSSNNFFSQEVERAAERVLRSDQMFRTLIIGPGYFSNLPLEYLLARGEVVGVDVYLDAMQEAKKCLKPHEQARLACVQVDASLFASPAIDFLEEEISQGALDANLFVSLHNSGVQAVENMPRQHYPFRDEGFDLIICISTLAQLTMTFAGIIQDLLEEKFDQEAVQSFFAAKVRGGGCRGDYIGSIYAQIFDAVFMSQFREFARMLKMNGALFVSDHFLRGECGRFEGSRGQVLFSSLSPNCDYQSGGKIEFTSEAGLSEQGIEIRLRERDLRMSVSGDDMLSKKASAANLGILDSFWFWNLASYFDEENIYEVSFDEAVVAAKFRE